MKIVAFSDYHNNGKIDVPDGDVLVIAGDICKFGRLDDFDEFISGLPHKHKLLVAGNHDYFAKRGEAHKIAPSMKYLQDEVVVIDGKKFYGTPWHNVYTMPFGVSNEELKDKWDPIPEDTDVLITHMPPNSILDGGGWGCSHLARRITQIAPLVCIFGHSHIGHGSLDMFGTRYYNVALCNGRYEAVNNPTIIEI